MTRYYVQVSGRETAVDIVQHENGTLVSTQQEEGEQRQVAVDLAPVHSDAGTGVGLYSLVIEGRSYQVYVEKADEGFRIAFGRHLQTVAVLSEREWKLRKAAPRSEEQTGTLVIKAPMPGLVKAVLVSEGAEVQQGERLLVLEAMKMENEIAAPRTARVAAVHVQAGTTIDGGKPLITLE